MGLVLMGIVTHARVDCFRLNIASGYVPPKYENDT
jgi:hypothetical protein